MQIDVWNDGSVKTVNISKDELLRDYEYVCESSECEMLAFNSTHGECPMCYNCDSVRTVEDFLVDWD